MEGNLKNEASFPERFSYGREAEYKVLRWLNSKGWSAFQIELDKEKEKLKKGPRLQTPSAEYILPDIQAYKKTQTLWVEVKHMEAFTWHRKTQKWVTGFSYYLYKNYCKINDISPFKVYLFFIQENGFAKDSPLTPDSGLFINSLDKLRGRENHVWLGNENNKAMIYWSIDRLIKKAELNEL
jgi:hypothetical protein